VVVVRVLQLVTAVFSRSFIAADDTTAVSGLTPDALGAPLLPTMTKISCMDGVPVEEVRSNTQNAKDGV